VYCHLGGAPGRGGGHSPLEGGEGVAAGVHDNLWNSGKSACGVSGTVGAHVHSSCHGRTWPNVTRVHRLVTVPAWGFAAGVLDGALAAFVVCHVGFSGTVDTCAQ
jgi:hypothetical protein